MKFEWDTQKAERNFRKHKVAFTEAATVFADTLGITIYDPDHSKNEERYVTIGWSHQGRILMVAHTDRGDRIRIISARELTKKERKAYEEGK
ncbi:MAG: BrnT family toxin [Bacteroidetes bacterium]|nr:BrnT family toxin [Bacteroidota bacterium]MBU2584878.1 BrnT family toxin [Bacteroidota bacterium]